MPNIDLGIHLAELLIMGGAAWKGIKALNRFTSVLKDFPPHRHINGSIIYPDDYAPPMTQKLEISGNR
jgi:hypothetical protein